VTIWEQLPPRLRSVRLRLALLYSSVLFGLAALLVGGLYLGVRASIDEPYVTDRVAVRGVIKGPDGRWRPVDVVQSDYRDFEREVNARTLERLRNYSFGALAGLFCASIGVGWVIAGRVLAPIGRVTGVARDIQATDLSRRIRMDGPDDELKQLADTFDGMLERLEGAFASQRRFVADASHELRNPIATIRTNLDLVPGAGSPEEAARLVDAARRAAERMGRLTDDLLVLAREGTPLARREPVDLAEAAAGVVDEFDARARERGVSLERDGPPGVTVSADPDATKRALANLLDNAVRLAPEGSVIRVTTGRERAWAFLAVSDEGPGMTLDQRDHAFDRFWRADPSRTRTGGGSGLGLAIVRQIADAHGGAARAFSEPNRGSTFVVWFPVIPEAGEPPESPAAVSGRPGVPVRP
jgi:signal transduction histidine kinase